MRFTVVALCALLLGNSAQAQDFTFEVSGFEWRVLTNEELTAFKESMKGRGYDLPPERFDHFNPDIEILVTTMAKIARVCRYHGSRSATGLPAPAKACAFGHRSPCLIILPRDTPHKTAYFRHEMGHCNGWPGSHPP